jgi:hypothetical protein
MTLRLSPAELHTLQGQPPRQLSLFKGRRQRGTKPPPPLEYTTHVMVADDLTRFCRSDWQWTHIPSGEYRDIRTAMRLKRMGLRKGWPDFMLFNQVGAGHFLELKRKGEALTDAQQAFASWCQDRPMVRHAVAYSYQEARRILIAWGALRGIA